jgi:hypothetical protein
VYQRKVSLRGERPAVILEWATTCQNAEEVEGRPNVLGLGANGFFVDQEELPAEIPCPVILAFRFDRSDTPGMVLGLNYRVIDPKGTMTRSDRVGVEWNPGTAPQLVDPERIIRVLTIPMTVRGQGQHTIEVWADGEEPIRLPLLFSTLDL